MIKPTIEEAAVYYQELGRYLSQRGNQDTARLAYFYSIQSWDEASMENPRLIDRYQAAEHEYAEFAKTDIGKAVHTHAARPADRCLAGAPDPDRPVLARLHVEDAIENAAVSFEVDLTVLPVGRLAG